MTTLAAMYTAGWAVSGLTLAAMYRAGWAVSGLRGALGKGPSAYSSSYAGSSP